MRTDSNPKYTTPGRDPRLLRTSAMELARRSLKGNFVYPILGLIAVTGTHVAGDHAAACGAGVALLALLGGLRFFHARGFEARYDRIGERAVREFLVLTALLSAAFSILGAAIICHYGTSQEALLAFVFCAGTSAAGTSSLSVRRPVHLTFLACIHTPLYVAAYAVWGIQEIHLLAGFAVFTIFLARDGKFAREAYHGLIAAQEEAERANRAKGRFLSAMGHELRTPLNGILGFAGLLEKQFYGPLNAKQLEYVRTIDASGNHLLGLIDDLLDIGKIDSGAVKLDCAPVPARMLLETAEAMVDNAAREKNIEIDVHAASDLIVWADVRRGRQILVNLLSNAIKFTPEGGRIVVRAEAHTESFFKITVRDTGVGINAAEQDKVFNEFYQTDHARDAALGGSGIGLGIARSLVELHGGGIGVQSAPGSGSLFWFTLPVYAPDGAEPEVAAEAESSKDDMPANRRILVAEDNATNLALILEVLSIYGHKVEVARNGREAVALAEKTGPALILMDVRMPILDGLEATRQIRKMDGFKCTPIVALSASVDAESVKASLDAGCDVHIAKPVTVAKLMEVLRDHLPKEK